MDCFATLAMTLDIKKGCPFGQPILRWLEIITSYQLLFLPCILPEVLQKHCLEPYHT